MSATTDWQEVVATYKDDETDAEISRGITAAGQAVYRLAWDDQMVNEWAEDFPTLNLARGRLADLIAALTRPDKGFSTGYGEYLGRELGWSAAFGWGARDYIAALERAGYKPFVTELGGGLYAVECASTTGAVISWAENNEGHARVGYYPAHLMAGGTIPAMTSWTEDQLTALHGQLVADALATYDEVYKEGKDSGAGSPRVTGGF